MHTAQLVLLKQRQHYFENNGEKHEKQKKSSIAVEYNTEKGGKVLSRFLRRSVKKGKKMSQNAWINQMFRAKSVRRGGVIRRSRSSVLKYASLELLEREVLRRGFHLVEVGDQFVVICNTGDLRLVL